MTRLIIVFYFAFSFGLHGQVPLDESGSNGSVEFWVVDPEGRPTLDGPSISVQRMSHGRLDPATTIGRRVTLPYGTYKVTVHGSPAYPTEKTVTIDQRYQLVIVALFIAPIEAPWAGNRVHGKLPATSMSQNCRVVRLISPVSENEYFNTKALESGDFGFNDVKPGRYVMITLGDHGICELLQTTVYDRPEQDLIIR